MDKRKSETNESLTVQMKKTNTAVVVVNVVLSRNFSLKNDLFFVTIQHERSMYTFAIYFSVGVFEETARLLQWLVFSVSSRRLFHILCTVQLRHKSLVLDFERIQSIYHEIQNPYSKAETSPFPLFFQYYKTYPFSALWFLFRKFNVSIGTPTIC